MTVTEESAATARLARLVAIPTVSRADPAQTDWAMFLRFREELAACYPLTFARCEVELVAGHTLLIRWPGRGEGDPAVLMAHQDVVDPGTRAWTHPPFAAEIRGDGPDRTLWGRGTIDDKGSLAAILEAVEHHLAAGYTPQRDIFFVFGHDEETVGSGAAAAVEVFRARGLRPAFVIDEGGAIVSGFLPGVRRPLAAIGVAEKGVATLRLSVEDEGGHGSTPPRLSAIGRLSRAIARMDARPFPSRFTPTLRALFEAAGTGAGGVRGWVYRNARITGPLLRRALVRSGPEGDAMTRTTRVATTISGGHAHNAIPETATAIVNVRILPGSTVPRAAAHIRDAIDDPRVRVEVLDGQDPSPVSPTEGPGWDELVAALAEVVPEAIPTPYPQTGATDARWFASICDRVYRFVPFDLRDAERAALHAVDERVRVDSWLRGVAAYRALIARL